MECFEHLIPDLWTTIILFKYEMNMHKHTEQNIQKVDINVGFESEKKISEKGDQDKMFSADLCKRQ